MTIRAPSGVSQYPIIHVRPFLLSIAGIQRRYKRPPQPLWVTYQAWAERNCFGSSWGDAQPFQVAGSWGSRQSLLALLYNDNLSFLTTGRTSRLWYPTCSSHCSRLLRFKISYSMNTEKALPCTRLDRGGMENRCRMRSSLIESGYDLPINRIATLSLHMRSKQYTINVITWKTKVI